VSNLTRRHRLKRQNRFKVKKKQPVSTSKQPLKEKKEKVLKVVNEEKSKKQEEKEKKDLIPEKEAESKPEVRLFDKGKNFKFKSKFKTKKKD